MLRLLVIGLILLAGSARAQTPVTPEWEKLVAQANQEGELELLIVANSVHRDFLAAEWPKAFPNISLHQITLQIDTEIPRIEIERSSGKYLWDLGFTGSDNAFEMRDAGMLDPMLPEFTAPDVNNPAIWGGWSESFMDRGHEYAFAPRYFLKMPFYNAALLSPDKVEEEGTKIFLDPSLKKKVIWQDPLFGGSGRTLAPVLLNLLGEDGLRKFVQENAVFTTTMPDLIDRMARGEYAMALGPVLPPLLVKYKEAGIKLDIRPTGNTPARGAYGNSGGSIMVLFNKRPHPAATRVFLNWYLSKAVQEPLVKVVGEDSRRTDIPQFAPKDQQRVPGVKYFDAQTEANTPLARKAQDLIKVWRSGG